MGLRTRARFAGEGWWKPRTIVPVPELPRTAGRPRGPSEQGRSHPGQLVEPAGPQARITLCNLVNPAGTWTQANRADDCIEPMSGPGRIVQMTGRTRELSVPGPRALDSRSTPRSLGSWPWSPGTAGRTCGTSKLAQIRPRLLVVPAAPLAQARVARDSCTTPGHSGTFRVVWDSWWTPRAVPHGPEMPRKAGRHRRPSNKVPRHPGPPVDPAGPRTQVRVARVSRLTPRTLGLWPESPRTTGRPHRPSETSQSHPGLLVNAGGPQTQARDAQDSWSTPRALGNGPESPKGAGRPHVPSDSSAIHPGEHVETADP